MTEITKTTETTTDDGTILDITDEQMEGWSDEDVLRNLVKFFGRVEFSTEFVQNEDGLIIGQTLYMSSGDKMCESEPRALDWPLQPLPMPDAFKDRIN